VIFDAVDGVIAHYEWDTDRTRLIKELATFFNVKIGDEPTNIECNGEYIGGNANQPHIHKYPSGFHLKLPHRYNIVQGSTFYKESCRDAIVALSQLKGQGKAWGQAMKKETRRLCHEYGKGEEYDALMEEMTEGQVQQQFG